MTTEEIQPQHIGGIKNNCKKKPKSFFFVIRRSQTRAADCFSSECCINQKHFEAAAEGDRRRYLKDRLAQMKGANCRQLPSLVSPFEMEKTDASSCLGEPSQDATSANHAGKLDCFFFFFFNRLGSSLNPHKTEIFRHAHQKCASVVTETPPTSELLLLCSRSERKKKKTKSAHYEMLCSFPGPQLRVQAFEASAAFSGLTSGLRAAKAIT